MELIAAKPNEVLARRKHSSRRDPRRGFDFRYFNSGTHEMYTSSSGSPVEEGLGWSSRGSD